MTEKKKRRPKPLRDVNGYWMKGSNGGHTGRKPWKWTDEKLNELADDLVAWVNDNVEKKKEFLLGDWCYKIGICPPTLNDFIERHNKLRTAHKYAKCWQEHMICKGALFKKLDPGFSKFMLICTHGWKEHQLEEDKEEALKNDFSRFNKNMEELGKTETDE